MNSLPQVQFFQSTDGTFSLEVLVQNESVWLNESQLALLFDRDRSVLNRHIRSIFNEAELDEKSNVQNMHIPNSDKPVDPQSLVALTLLIAESNPQQKDLMIKLIINLIAQF